MRMMVDDSTKKVSMLFLKIGTVDYSKIHGDRKFMSRLHTNQGKFKTHQIIIRQIINRKYL